MNISFLRISHEFYVFNLDQSFLFFIPSYHFVWHARLHRPDGEVPNTLLTIFEHNRYFSGSIFKREAWRKGTYLIYKEDSIIEKNHPERSIIQKFPSKNINQYLLDLHLCCEFLKMCAFGFNLSKSARLLETAHNF